MMMIMYTNHQRHKFAKWKKSNQKFLQSFMLELALLVLSVLLFAFQ